MKRNVDLTSDSDFGGVQRVIDAPYWHLSAKALIEYGDDIESVLERECMCVRCGRRLVPWTARYGVCSRCNTEMDNEDYDRWGIPKPQFGYSEDPIMRIFRY